MLSKRDKQGMAGAENKGMLEGIVPSSTEVVRIRHARFSKSMVFIRQLKRDSKKRFKEPGSTKW